MVLRPVMVPDIPVIVELDRLAFPADEQYERSFYDIMLTQGNFEATAFVDSQGTIVGWALLDIARTPIHLRSISIHPTHQREGHAKALLRSLIARHSAPMDLLVLPSNEPAIKLYEELGFVAAEADPSVPERKRMVLNASRIGV